jgi:hypothetical protein
MFACLSATPYYGRLTVFSQGGWLEARESGNVDRGLPSANTASETHAFAAAPTVRANIESWAAAVLGETPYRFSAAEILDSTRVLEAVVWSSRNGSAEVALDTL